MILIALAEALGVPILTDFASDDQDTFRVILPTGEALARFADDDADIVYEPGDAERLAPYKRPVALTVLADIPKNPVGKIDKSRLRRDLAVPTS